MSQSSFQNRMSLIQMVMIQDKFKRLEDSNFIHKKYPNGYHTYYNPNSDVTAKNTTAPYVIYTRGGNLIANIFITDPNPASYDECIDMIEPYDGCSIIEYGIGTYNCHAYAWLNLDAANRLYRKSCIVNSITAFIDDNKYHRSSICRANSVVTMNNHSAWVVNLSAASAGVI